MSFFDRIKSSRVIQVGPIRTFINIYKKLKFVLNAPYKDLDLFLNTPSYYYGSSYKKIDISKDILVFSRISAEIVREGCCCLDYDRLYTLYQCLKQLPDNSVVMEVGVYKGGGSKFISSILKNGGKLYACDTFSGHSTVDSRFDGLHKRGGYFSDVSLEDVKEYLSNRPNITILVGDIMDTYTEISEPVINMIHLDVDVYPPTRFVLEKFWGKIPKNGYVVVDDYGFTTCKGAKKAVDEFVVDHDDCVYFHLLTGQAVLIKTQSSLSSKPLQRARHAEGIR